MKFLFRYGIFLIKVINNEYEGVMMFEKAQQIYHNKISKQYSSAAKTEQTTFGENSGAGVVIVEATASSFGTIIHTNEELEHVLGYSRSDLLEKNVNFVMPPLISRNHSAIFQNYLNTGRSTVIDKHRQVFAVNKNGYLQLIELLVKVHA
jgi:PAS domain S-box-containing protein